MKFKLENRYLIYLLIIFQMGCSSEEFGGNHVYEINSSVSPIDGGSISPSTGNYDSGDKVTIEATAAEGYQFKNWAGDISGSNNPYTLTISSNTTIIAIFEKIDTDKDGITDDKDDCPNTPVGELVNTSGCSESQIDSDNDGISDDIDECPETEEGQNVDENGCSTSQTDSDGDGVFDDIDECPETAEGVTVDEFGCSETQIDSDEDGVMDDMDLCPDTSPGLSVDENGCSNNQKDTDNDGVTDEIDQCPNTSSDAEVDQFGCSEGETDGDNDGVINANDVCPNTPTGESVNEVGCSISQTDSDNDGVTDNIDLCAGTPSGESVDDSGCSDSQKDSDNDGITDDNDQCPGTPFDQSVDDNGCSLGQNDSDGDGIFDDVDDCPNTDPNDTADSNGCAEAQKDTDNDGVTNDIDLCPSTPSNEDADENGCSESQKDSDGDGVTDDKDQCPDTSAGNDVDETGCEIMEKTYIPDNNFEQNLINKGHDDVLDDYVLTSNIENITSLGLTSDLGIGIYADMITDFTGIEDFTSLEELRLYGLTITRNNIDLTNNQNLKRLLLNCSSFEGADLSQNTNLEELQIAGDYDDHVSCGATINQLNLSNNTNLKKLLLGGATTDNLDLIINSAPSIEDLILGILIETVGDMTTLNLSNNSKLKTVYISNYFGGPKFFERINFKNGANLLLERFEFYKDSSNEVIFNVCIEADDPNYVQSKVIRNGDTGGINEEINVIVTSNCDNLSKTYVPDDTFEQNLINQGLDDILDDYVLTSNIQNISSLALTYLGDINQEIISDYTGIEDFVLLEELTITGTGFAFPYNMIVDADNIDLSNNKNLRVLNLRCLDFDNVDLSQNTNLEELSISGGLDEGEMCVSSVYKLDLSSNSKLKTLGLGGLTTDNLDLIISSASSIEILSIGDISETVGNMETLNLSNNSNLKDFQYYVSPFIVPYKSINFKNGSNNLLVRFHIVGSIYGIGGVYDLCIEADNPTYIESILTVDEISNPPLEAVNIEVNSDCGF